MDIQPKNVIFHWPGIFTLSVTDLEMVRKLKMHVSFPFPGVVTSSIICISEPVICITERSRETRHSASVGAKSSLNPWIDLNLTWTTYLLTDHGQLSWFRLYHNAMTLITLCIGALNINAQLQALKSSFFSPRTTVRITASAEFGIPFQISASSPFLL